MRKDVTAAEVHVSTTAQRRRKPPPMILNENKEDGADMTKAARTLKPNHEDDGETALSPFPYDPNALANIRPDQTPRFFGALTDPSQLDVKRMKMSDLTAMQNRVDPKKVDAMAGVDTGKKPVVVSMAGRNYIADGHHRATRAWLDGADEIDVHHKDLEPVSNVLERADVLALFDRVGKAVAEDNDADADVTSALVQVMHDCACAIGAQCRDVEQDAQTKKRDDSPAGGGDSWAIPFKVTKADPEQQLIFGWASVVEENGRLIIDKQGDAILPADLEKAAYDFVLYARQHGEMHKQIGTGRLVESVVFTTEKQVALGISLGKVGWWVGFKVDDQDTWAAHKRGELPEFSIGGSGRRVEA